MTQYEHQKNIALKSAYADPVAALILAALTEQAINTSQNKDTDDGALAIQTAEKIKTIKAPQ